MAACERGAYLILKLRERASVLMVIPVTMKNITRYTYENTDFQGWRVSIQRCGRIITRYFSDLQYGSEEASQREALAYRDRVLRDIERRREDLPQFMDEELALLQVLLREKEGGFNPR